MGRTLLELLSMDDGDVVRRRKLEIQILQKSELIALDLNLDLQISDVITVTTVYLNSPRRQDQNQNRNPNLRGASILNPTTTTAAWKNL